MIINFLEIPAISYVIAFLWGFFILLSLIGWGTLVNFSLFPQYSLDWGQRSAWGIAFSILVGSVLNLTELISPPLIIVYLVFGFFASLYFYQFLALKTIKSYGKLCRQDRLLLCGSLIFIGLLIIQYGGWVVTSGFHPADDYFAYLVFPNKMLQMGALGDDPFSARRLVSSLGGYPFLQTFILSVLSEENLRILDPGIGYFIIVGLIIGYLPEKKISPRIGIIILLGCVSLIIPPTRNTTSMAIGSALFLSLFRTLQWENFQEGKLINRAIVIALLVSAIFSLKNNYIPGGVLFILLSYFFTLLNNQFRKTIIYEMLTAAGLTVLFLLPWMISLYQSSGTLLYPLLGEGYSASKYYDHYLSPSSEVFTGRGIKWLIRSLLDVYALIFYLLAGVYLRIYSLSAYKLENRGVSFAVIISTGLSFALIMLSIGGRSGRYAFAFIYPAIILLVLEITSRLIERYRKGKNVTKILGVTVVSIILIVTASVTVIEKVDSIDFQFYQKQLNNIKLALTHRITLRDQDTLKRYRKMQESVPPGEIILERLDQPFVLDFKRNQIFLADQPGTASPPPGMPLFQGPEKLKDYLISQSIRYVAYDYAAQPGINRGYWVGRLGDEIYPSVKPNKILDIHPWIRIEIQYTLDFHENLRLLGANHQKIYDDGKTFVIDLSSPLGLN